MVYILQILFILFELYATAPRIAKAIKKQTRNVKPKVTTNTSTLSQIFFNFFKIIRFKKLNTALISPPTKPPTTGTISQRATEFPPN